MGVNHVTATISCSRWAGLLAVAAGAVLLSGCSGPGKTTCDELAALSYEEQTRLEHDLLRAHDLDPYSAGNITGLRQNLQSYCGLSGMSMGAEHTRTAGQNNTAPIEDAVNWESSSW